MINLVFETIEEKKTRIVFRTDRVYETIRVEKKHVCSKCGGSMVGRPDWHWLCYSCWTKQHYGYDGGHGRWYGSQTPKIEVNEIKGYVDKKVEVKEEYSESHKRIATIPNPEYHYSNKIIRKSISSVEEMINYNIKKNNNLFIDDYIELYKFWFNAKSNQDAYLKVNQVNTDKFKFKIKKMPHITIGEKRTKKEFNDMVGYFPNVPAYIQGNPLSMFNRKITVTYSPIVKLFFDLTVDSSISSDQYKHKGIIVYNLIENFMTKKLDIHFNLFCMMFSENQTLHLEIKVDLANWDKEKKYVFYALTDVSFFSIHVLNYVNQISELEKHWKKGFGFTMPEDVIRKILQIHRSDLVFANPASFNIVGKDINIDNHHVLTKVKLI